MRTVTVVSLIAMLMLSTVAVGVADDSQRQTEYREYVRLMSDRVDDLIRLDEQYDQAVLGAIENYNKCVSALRDFRYSDATTYISRAGEYLDRMLALVKKRGEAMKDIRSYQKKIKARTDK